MFKLLDVVEITKDFLQEGISKGAVGTIIECYQTPSEGYEVEFLDEEGYTKAVLTLKPSDFELVRNQQ